MFKVMCIDGIKAGLHGISYWPFLETKEQHTATKQEEIYEGETYTVVSEEEYFGIEYYQLQERPETTIYNSKRFIRLTDSAEIVAEHQQESIIYAR